MLLFASAAIVALAVALYALHLVLKTRRAMKGIAAEMEKCMLSWDREFRRLVGIVETVLRGQRGMVTKEGA